LSAQAYDTPSTVYLNAGVVQQLQSNVAKLGGLDAPANVDPQAALAIRAAIAESFIYGFRLIMILCAVLAVTSAGVAWWIIPAKGLPAIDVC